MKETALLDDRLPLKTIKTVDELVEKIKAYYPQVPVAIIEKAYAFSEKAHVGQMRRSGEPYITHPLSVAGILADLKLDIDTILTGLLHDTVEDTRMTIEEIKSTFGDEVAQLVDGVTKLGQINYTSKEEQQAENLRKMFMYMAKDIRVIMIKLADRLHNMRTLKYLSPERQLEKAKETLEIYVPI